MTDEARVMSRVALPEETQLERQLRPQRLDEYVGQSHLLEDHDGADNKYHSYYKLKYNQSFAK